MNSPQKPEKNGNVVKGPWPDIKDRHSKKVAKDLKFAEKVTKSIMTQMLTTFKYNNFDTSNKLFNRDIGFTVEVIKSVIYRSMGYEHPLHDFIGNILNITKIQEGENVYYDTSLNIDIINEMTEYISINPNDDDDDDEPERA